MQSEAACKVAEEGKLEQEKLKDEAAAAYSKMDESLQKVRMPHNLAVHWGKCLSFRGDWFGTRCIGQVFLGNLV